MPAPLDYGFGVGLALLLIDRMITYAKVMQARRNGKGNGHAHPKAPTAGDQPPEFWQAEQRRAVAEVITATVFPILSTQTTILSEMKNEQQEFRVMMTRGITLIEELVRRERTR